MFFKYLVWGFAVSATLAYAAVDFCTEDGPCDEEEALPCPYCPSSYYFSQGNEDEDFHEVLTWPGKQDEPFMDALRR